MQVLKNTSIAVGIEWTLHDSISEAKKAAAGKKKILLVRKVIAGECVQGICETPPKSRKLQAGALLVASVAKDALIYHNLGDGFVWVCAIREGIPLHGFDVVVDEISAKSVLAEVMSYVPSADIYGDITGSKGSLEKLFAQVNSSEKKAATLAAPGGLVVVLVLVVVILLFVVIALFVFRPFEKKIGEDTSSLLQMQTAEDLRKAKEAFDAEVDKARKVFWYASSPSKQFAIWYDVLHRLPVSVNGWTPSTFTCDIKACLVVWTRGARALPSSVADLPGTPKVQAFNPTLKDFTTSFALDKLEPVMFMQSGARPDTYLLDLGVKDTLFKLVLTPTQTGVMVAPPVGVKGLVAVTIGVEGTWKATGNNPLLAPVYMQKLELPGIVLNTLSIKNLNFGKPHYTIELEGRYRVGY